MEDAVIFAQVESILKEELVKAAHRACDSGRQEDVGGLANKIADAVIETAVGLTPNFKYIANVCVTESGDSQLATSGSSFWDAQADGCLNFTLRKNDCLILVTVFALAL